jgi:glycosyltransferase involved in cell wall biosynthesis
LKRLNVLYLIRTWALGGSHTIIRLLMHHLPRDRFHIVTVPFDAPGRGNQDFVDSLRREGLDAAPERIPWRNRSNWFRARAEVEKLVQRYEIDLIHAHDTNSIVLVGAGRRRWPCACVASPYGWWEAKSALRTRMYHWVEKNVALPRFDRVITVSRNMKGKILEGRTTEDRIRVIHTGLDLAAFDSGQPREAVRAEFGFAPEHVVAGTVSRLFKEKGHAILFEAAGMLKERRPDLRLLVVGTGDEREPLERRARDLGIADRVVFTGFYEDLPGALRAMDIFVQPSVLEEGFPTAILEAQVMGLPIIASDIGGTNETLDAGVTGLLVPPGDARALAETLDAVAADPERRGRMAAAARPWIERSFTLENMTDSVARTYEEAIAAFHEQGAHTASGA